MKPFVPTFTPSMGTPSVSTWRATCSIVPSPPKVMMRSAPAAALPSGLHGRVRRDVYEGRAYDGGVPVGLQHCPGREREGEAPVAVWVRREDDFFHPLSSSP